MELKRVKISELRPYWRNPRINDKAVEGVMESIRRYGYNQPILVDKEMVIVAGHTRHKALLRLGITDVYVVTFEGTQKQAKEYRIIDNKTSELAEWDNKSLIPELREFENLPEFQVFFPDIDIQAFVMETAGFDQKEVTQDEINDKQAALNDKFTNVAEERAGTKVELICPHCGETYFVDRKEL